MKYPMKKLVVLGVAVGASGLGIDAITPELAISCQNLDQIHERQVDEFSREGKYSQFTKNSLPSNVRVNEYKTSKGEVGYQILCEDSSGYYSVGVGAEAKNLTSFEPRQPDPVATSTRR